MKKLIILLVQGLFVFLCLLPKVIRREAQLLERVEAGEGRQRLAGQLVSCQPQDLHSGYTCSTHSTEAGWSTYFLPASGPPLGVNLQYTQYRDWLVNLLPASLRTSTRGKPAVHTSLKRLAGQLIPCQLQDLHSG